MNEVFERNLQALEKHIPSLHKHLSNEIEKFRASPQGDENESFKMVPGVNGTQNFQYRRKEPAFETLYHKPDGISEALKVIRSTNLHHPQLMMILGCGLGYLLQEFLRMRGKTTFGVLLIEKNPQIFLRALTISDWSEIFANKTIWYSIGESVKIIRSVLNDFFDHFGTVNRSIKVMATPSAMEADSDFYAETLQAVIPARDQSTIWCGNSVEDSFHGLQNILNNAELLCANKGIGPLFNLFEGKTCISVAAGPAVNEAWDILKQVQGKIPIIACDTLLKPMNERGIYPDFITALERDPIVADMFRGQSVHERTSLFGPNLLLPDAFDCFKGRHIIYCANPGYVVNMGFSHLGVFGPGSSAGNVNISAACQMGFKNILMIGHNLAFAHGSNESHVKGTIDKAREVHRSEEEMNKIATGGKVPTADGTASVYTIVEYNLFRKQIERTITAHKDKVFINTSAKGALIEGAEFMALEAAVAKYRGEDFDTYPLIKEKYAPLSKDDEYKRLAYFRRRLRAAVAALEEGQEVANERIEKLDSYKKLIDEGEAANEKVSLKFLNEKLDETIGIKLKMVNEKLEFSNSFVTVISPAHMAFERTVNALMGSHTDNYSLKKDFLLRHIQYFQIWNKWLKPIMDEYQKALSRVENRSELDVFDQQIKDETIPEASQLQLNQLR